MLYAPLGRRKHRRGWPFGCKRGPIPASTGPTIRPVFPFRIRKPLQGGWLYLVYRDEVYAYGRIARVTRHPGSQVGTFAQHVLPGEAIIFAGPAVPFPYPLACRWFAGLRYAPECLHERPFDAARRVIQRLRLSLL
jgi:hypothetical protein